MSDLIDRQEAIEEIAGAIWLYPNELYPTLRHYQNAKDLAECGLKDMPSAQPERKIELHGDESAIEILSELRSWFSCFDEKEGLAYHALSLAIRAIKANSTAEPERKGKWMRLNDIDGFVRCSNCGTFWDHSIIDTLHFHFCPRCGSYNGGEEDE